MSELGHAAYFNPINHYLGLCRPTNSSGPPLAVFEALSRLEIRFGAAALIRQIPGVRIDWTYL